MSEEPTWGMRRDALGINSLSKSDDGTVQVLVTEQRPGPSTDATLSELSQALIAVYGSDYGVHSPTSISRFSDMTRQAATTATSACCSRAMPRTFTLRWAARASTSGFRMR